MDLSAKYDASSSMHQLMAFRARGRMNGLQSQLQVILSNKQTMDAELQKKVMQTQKVLMIAST